MTLQTIESPATDLTDLYLSYAAEALRWSYEANTADNKKAFLDLALIWARAALHPEAKW